MTVLPAQTVHPLVPGGGFEVAGVVTSSTVDGPGHRFVVFLQGCNFDCIACHNPSTIGRCDGCGVCVDVCTRGALTVPAAGTVAFDSGSCDHCGDCLTVCPSDADPTIRALSEEDLVGELRRTAPFLRGVTISGGEPTRQLEPLIRFLRRLRSDPILSRLHVAIDTNGSLDEGGWRRLVPVIDGAMVDLKAGTPAMHRFLTGTEQAPVIATLRLLRNARKLMEVRLLVIEGITDTSEELEAWAAIVGGVDPTVPVRLMAFRHAGTRPDARRWPETSAERVENVATALTSLGLTGVQRAVS